MRTGGPPAVLRQIDQHHGRSPVACVKTGQRTDRAARVRATGLKRSDLWEAIAGSSVTWLVAWVARRQTTTVVLAVSEQAWRRWRGRVLRAVLVASCGLGFVVAGVVRADAGMVVLGVVVLAIGWWMRLRSWLACWVGLGYRSDSGEILVTRVHPAFADEARRIYVDSIQRHPSPR